MFRVRSAKQPTGWTQGGAGADLRTGSSWTSSDVACVLSARRARRLEWRVGGFCDNIIVVLDLAFSVVGNLSHRISNYWQIHKIVLPADPYCNNFVYGDRTTRPRQLSLVPFSISWENVSLQ